MRAALISLVMLSAVPAFADGGVTDSGMLEDGGFPALPDASVNTGMPDPSQEGEEGQIVTFCRQSSDCTQGFSCVDARCKYTGARLAACGCSAVSAPVVGLGLLAFGLWRRRR